MTKVHLTNEDFSLMAGRLCSQILKVKDQIQYVVGIERGGLPLSRWLSYALNKPHTSIHISFRDGPPVTTYNSFGWCKLLDKVKSEPFLLVDDIVDSGQTIKFFKDVTSEPSFNVGKIWVAALHWCPEASPDCKPDFFVDTKRSDQWIVYPWEKDEEDKK